MENNSSNYQIRMFTRSGETFVCDVQEMTMTAGMVSEAELKAEPDPSMYNLDAELTPQDIADSVDITSQYCK